MKYACMLFVILAAVEQLVVVIKSNVRIGFPYEH